MQLPFRWPILTFSVLVAIPGLVSAQPVKPPERSAAQLASAVLDALAYADVGRQRLEQIPPKKDLAVATDRMTNERIAKRRFQDGRELFVNELKSTREKVKAVGATFTRIFQALETGCDRAIALDEALLKTKTQDDVAKIASEASVLRAHMNQVWTQLPYGVRTLSAALVDEQRLTNGKALHLRLTSAERASLISRIGHDYPQAAQKRGAHATDVSAALLLSFLKGTYKSADEQ